MCNDTDSPVCPYCKHDEEDRLFGYGHEDGATNKHYCQCGKVYWVETHCLYSYSTERIKDQ